jgi:hypothetical protein
MKNTSAPDPGRGRSHEFRDGLASLRDADCCRASPTTVFEPCRVPWTLPAPRTKTGKSLLRFEFTIRAAQTVGAIVCRVPTGRSKKRSNNNLLLDVRNFGGGDTTSFDALGSSAFSRAFANDVTATHATNRDALGLVTEFNTTAASVPEPASIAALLISTSLVGVMRVIRKRN